MPRSTKPERLPVLFLEGQVVTCVRTGPSDERTERSARTAGRSLEELAALARELVAGPSPAGPSRACVLVLGSPFVEDRLLHLPTLSPRERRAVLARKAERLLGDQRSDPVFTASLVDLEGLAEGAGERARPAWHLCAARREHLASLRAAFAEAGLLVDSIVAARACELAWLREELSTAEPNPGGASIGISVGPTAAVVALFAGDRLVTRYVSKGDLTTTPAMGAGLLGDVRAAAGFWRKVSRGGRIGRVAAVGLDSTAHEALLASVEAALGTVELVQSAESGADAAGRLPLARIALRLTSAKLETRRSPLHQRAAATAVIGLALFAGMGVVDLDAERIEREASIASLRSRLERAEGRDRARVEDARRLGRAVERLESSLELAREGLPLAELVEAVTGAFEGRASCLGFAIDTDEDGRDVLVVRGRAGGEPLEFQRTLRELTAALEESPALEAVRAEPGPGLADREEGLEFTIRAEARRGEG